MKAFLLAAGLGTRLRPITDRIPKCLVPIHGKPLLEYWFELLERHGVDEVLINLHHLPDLVRAYVKQGRSRIQAHLFYEPELLGSAGTVRENRYFVQDEKCFYIIYADNMTNFDLSAIREVHERQDVVLTMGLFRTERPRECGIATLDAEGRIVEFVEKPTSPKSNLANAGIYVASPELFEFIPQDQTPVDFGFDVIPHLVGRMIGYPIEGFLMDIGTPEQYAKVQRLWPLG
jgi:mannose-1-phosphate guanylyltransferase